MPNVTKSQIDEFIKDLVAENMQPKAETTHQKFQLH